MFFFKYKPAYELRISDWSSDVCSSDLADNRPRLYTVAMSYRIPLPLRHPLHTGPTLRKAARHAAILAVLCILPQIGSASCRGRVCNYVYISVVPVSLKKRHIAIQ